MGFTPAQTDEMSLWELGACFAGFRRANEPEDALPPPPTPEQFKAMLERHESMVMH